MKRNQTITAIASVCLAALIAVIAPRVASACGSYGPPTNEDLVLRIAYADAYYMTHRDKKQLRALWTDASAKTVTNWTWQAVLEDKRLVKKVNIVSDTVATVDIEVHGWGYGEYTFTERLTLRKVDDSWKPVSRAEVPKTRVWDFEAVASR